MRISSHSDVEMDGIEGSVVVDAGATTTVGRVVVVVIAPMLTKKKDDKSIIISPIKTKARSTSLRYLDSLCK
jgi:hypothetical protein